MKNTNTLRYPLWLGVSAVLLALGCGEGGPGVPGSVDSPFDGPPPSSNGGVPSSANNPFQGGSSESGGYEPPSGSSGYEPPAAGGGFEPAPGGGNCLGTIKQLYDRCGVTEQILEQADIIEVERILELVCTAIDSSPSCSACVLPRLSSVSCTEFVDDGNGEGTEAGTEDSFDPCESACAGVTIDLEGGNGSAGSDGGGGSAGSAGNGNGGEAGAAGQAGGGNNGDLCGRCGDLAQCPALGLDVATCQQICGSAPPACVACINAAGTDCELIGSCLQGACAN